MCNNKIIKTMNENIFDKIIKNMNFNNIPIKVFIISYLDFSISDKLNLFINAIIKLGYQKSIFKIISTQK